MALKGMSMALQIVIVLVVVMVVAILVLTIFGIGISVVPEFTSFRNQCVQTGTQSCSVLNTLPADWSVPKPYKIGDVQQLGSCAEALGCSGSCVACSF